MSAQKASMNQRRDWYFLFISYQLPFLLFLTTAKKKVSAAPRQYNGVRLIRTFLLEEHSFGGMTLSRYARHFHSLLRILNPNKRVQKSVTVDPVYKKSTVIVATEIMPQKFINRKVPPDIKAIGYCGHLRLLPRWPLKAELYVYTYNIHCICL